MGANTKLILVGMKSSGKTTTGKIVARRLRIGFADMDVEIEWLHFEEKKEHLRFREIFKAYGPAYFRELETRALRAVSARLEKQWFVLATGGGLPLAEANRVILRGLGTVVFLDVCEEVLLPRIVAGGIPAFFPYPEDPGRSLAEVLAVRRPIYRALASITVPIRAEKPPEIAEKILRQLEEHHAQH